ncbi:MAG TPA: alanine racemase [Rhizomicrobium sp.]|nr:alanine racemase [Rhizomicrobium sp.]
MSEHSENFEVARLTVRLEALASNYRTYCRLASSCAVAAVVKADGYGLGAGPVATRLADAGCDSFFVARLQEGIALRAILPRSRIFVLDGAPSGAVPALISHRLIPVLNSLDQIATWSAAASAGRQVLDAVVHVDTGMNRLGLSGDELSVLAAESVTRLSGLNLVLVMSHLACADDPANRLNSLQLSRFRQVLAMLPPAPASLAASHGTMLGMEYHFDLVRPGVALYGANPLTYEGTGEPAPNPMQSVAVLRARVLQLRRIQLDECVGYGATFRAKRSTALATIGLGYADGFPRALSGKGFAVLNGARVPIVGRVSMDTIVLDVTDMVEAPRVGDEAELLGERVGLSEVAALAGTNEYEILARLRRIPIVYEGR